MYVILCSMWLYDIPPVEIYMIFYDDFYFYFIFGLSTTWTEVLRTLGLTGPGLEHDLQIMTEHFISPRCLLQPPGYLLLAYLMPLRQQLYLRNQK